MVKLNDFVAGAVAVGSIVAIIGGAGKLAWEYADEEITTIIRGTEVKRYDSEDKYLIFTEHGTFENTDSLSRFKFRSSDLQGIAKKLQDKEVRITKYGWRNGLFSMYENVTDIQEVK